MGGLDDRLVGMRWWWLLAACAGCVRSHAVTCDDGRLCPSDYVCVPNGCRAIGECGDGYVNVDEECDDGNLMSHDGCSSGCLVERPIWLDKTAADGPALRRGHAMAWLPDAGHGVLHGGTGELGTGPNGGGVHADTWVWAGTWTRGPDGPDRTFHAISYDGDGALRLFGGMDDAIVRHADMWTWTGDGWTAVPVTDGPSARYDCAMAPGARPGEVLVLAGFDATGIVSDTWMWRAGAWTQMVPFDNRLAAGLRLAYWPARNSVVATGGVNAELYVWQGDAWGAEDSALIRVYHAQAYDPARRRIIAFGGATAGKELSSTIEWDGVDWRRPTLESQPPKRTFSTGFYDPIRHGFVMFGGDGPDATYLADTWMLRWESATPDEACDGTTDADGDGATGCADPDCWARCTPRCQPGTDCDPGAPHCGDHACNPALETHELCPDDC
jgi:cysteine-rich repeat protein